MTVEMTQDPWADNDAAMDCPVTIERGPSEGAPCVYDPRRDSTNGGDGPQRLHDPTTWKPSRNPALLLASLIAASELGRIGWAWIAQMAEYADSPVALREAAARRVWP
jgi:hypothetical protein